MHRTVSLKRSASGFTLPELMMTLAVAGVLLGIAVPNMRSFGQNNRLAGAANDMLHSFHLARSEAVKRQQTVVVCASSDPTAANPTCSYGAFRGWIVFQDDDGSWQRNGSEQVIETHALLDSTVTVSTDNNGIESYSQTGFANPTAAKTPSRTIVICDARGNSYARAVLISNTGRILVTRDSTQVGQALSRTGGSCP